MCAVRNIYLSDDQGRIDAVNELLEAANHALITLVVGAGISKSPPASLPLAGELVKAACKVIAANLGISLDVLLTRSGEVMRLEPFLRLFEVVSSVEDVEVFLDVLRNGEPNINHRAIALLLKNYEGSKVISLNFDCLIEEALLELNILAKAIVPKEITTEIVIPVSGDYGFPLISHNTAMTLELLKPHGSIIKYGGTRGVIATIQKVGSGLPQPMRNKIIEYANGRILLITGYSDEDIDLFPLIQSTSPQAVYWNSLHVEIPTKVENWFMEISSKIPVTHLIGKCEYLFQEFPRSLKTRCALEEYHPVDAQLEEWLKGLNSTAKVATIAAWLAQDRHRIDIARHLYNLALIQQECKFDIRLCRFIRYRYAELLRHQAKEKKSALKEYFKVIVDAFKKPVELPIFIVVIRSLAAQSRSAFHHSPIYQGLVSSVFSVLLLLSVSFLIRLTPELQWKNSRYYRDREGTWLKWELAMIFLGYALKVPWPSRIRQVLLIKTFDWFKKAENSSDLYERSAAFFGQARTMAALAWLLGDDEFSRKAHGLLDEALYLFRILDDVTGLENAEKLRQAVYQKSSDPWLSS